MKKSQLLIVALILLASLPVAHAACTDPARPKVEWQRCYHDDNDLSAVNLDGAQLRDATFQRSNLSRAILTKVHAFGAKLISTNLSGANLDNSMFSEADFTKADLSGATLRNTNLQRARLYRATLRKADLTGARMDGADLLEADLTGATWTDGKHVCAAGSIGQCN
ncbi:MAG: pentapeptide repeat-containing protein [Alphaproteobacteria bacterium]|nr:pentapeptide repeat-containing protein [Alphaproteobacteria bacterium]